MKHLLSSSAFFVVNKKLSQRVGIQAAILLADLIGKEQYFIDNGMLSNGWFFNTSDNILKDTTLTRFQQNKAITLLKEIKFLDCKLKGIPATLHFKILEDNIYKYFKTSIKETSKLDLKKLETNNTKVIKNKNKDISIREQKFSEEVYFSNLSTEVCKEFVDYWTEKNKSGTKMKFELQKTFDIKRRLSRWAKNDKKWNTNTSKLDSQIDSYHSARLKLMNNESKKI